MRKKKCISSAFEFDTCCFCTVCVCVCERELRVRLRERFNDDRIRNIFSDWWQTKTNRITYTHTYIYILYNIYFRGVGPLQNWASCFWLWVHAMSGFALLVECGICMGNGYQYGTGNTNSGIVYSGSGMCPLIWMVVSQVMTCRMQPWSLPVYATLCTSHICAKDKVHWMTDGNETRDLRAIFVFVGAMGDCDCEEEALF